jgi:hypothetical protein
MVDDPQYLPRRFPTIVERIGRRPFLAGAGLLSLITGFIVAGAVDEYASRWIRAEDPGEHGRADPDVWPVMEQSFPSQIDLLSPKPLMTPVPSFQREP